MRKDIIDATESDLERLTHAELIEVAGFWKRECIEALEQLEDSYLKGQEYALHLLMQKANFYNRKGEMLPQKPYITNPDLKKAAESLQFKEAMKKFGHKD